MRTAALALLVALLCVPALTRVGQTLDISSSANPTVGFSKAGGNVPPEPVVVEPQDNLIDLVVQPAIVPVAHVARFTADALPTAPEIAETSGLRAPPSSL
jgi:hypothetical protein